MLSKEDILKLYDTVLSTPGMQEVAKLDLRMQRKNVLLLSKAIQRGLKTREAIDKEEDFDLFSDQATVEELQKLVEELLQKAGLKEMIEKLDSFTP